MNMKRLRVEVYRCHAMDDYQIHRKYTKIGFNGLKLSGSKIDMNDSKCKVTQNHFLQHSSLRSSLFLVHCGVTALRVGADWLVAFNKYVINNNN